MFATFLLPLLLAANVVQGLRYNIPFEQQPMQGAPEFAPLVIGSDELGLASHNLINPHRVHSTFPSPNASALVKPVLATLKASNMRADLEVFTNFTTRRTFRCSLRCDRSLR